MKQRVIYIKTAEHCQLNCLHCFTGGSEVPRTFFDLSHTVTWLDALTQIDGQDAIYNINIQGGEPLLADLHDLELLLKSLRELPNVKTVGLTANLVFKPFESRLNAIQRWFEQGLLTGITTSWDPAIRFNGDQESTWLHNLKALQDIGIEPSLNVSMSKATLALPPDVLLDRLISFGVQEIVFEPVTADGSATRHNVIPSNAQRDVWRVVMHEAIVRRGIRRALWLRDFEELYAKFEDAEPRCGTFCRRCERTMITINANGTLGTCPNSASQQSLWNIRQPPEMFLESAYLRQQDLKERRVPAGCVSCDVYQYCGGGCHILPWEGNVCPQPKTLMRKLAQEQ